MWRCMVQPARRGASAVRMARARPPTVAATVAARAPVRLFHHCLGGGGKNCGGLGFPSPLPTRPAQTQWRLFSEQAPKRPKQQYAAPGRPGPSRNTQPVAPGARKNVANFLAAALIAATFGWAGYMYTQRTGPFKLVKTEEELAADAAREQGKLEWLRARDPDNAEVTDRVYFDIAANGKPLGRVVVGLFGKTAPRTVANFLALAGPDGIPVPAGGGDNGDRAGGDGGSGAGGKEARQVGFKGTVFHRIIPKFMIQGGDVTHNTGFGGYSLYGRSFADESFDLWHVRPGVLSMANAGPNTNSSQFFITTSATPWLDQRHVVFGRVTDGYRVVRQVERLGTKSGRPQRRVEIVRCGVMTEEHYAAYLAEVARRRAQREAEASEE